MNKILIIGHGRHGKDTVAELLEANFHFTFKSSSEAAAEIFLYDLLKEKYGYTSFTECYEDRSNHRAEWYDNIVAYNTPDKTKLARAIMDISDCYVGMRDHTEIKECKTKGVFDYVIWVDALDRLPPEPSDSFNITKQDADLIIDNNGSLEQLKDRVLKLGTLLNFKRK